MRNTNFLDINVELLAFQETKRLLADNPRYKAYRRYMKKGKFNHT